MEKKKKIKKSRNVILSETLGSDIKLFEPITKQEKV